MMIKDAVSVQNCEDCSFGQQGDEVPQQEPSDDHGSGRNGSNTESGRRRDVRWFSQFAANTSFGRH